MTMQQATKRRKPPSMRAFRLGLILALLATLAFAYMQKNKEEAAQAAFEVISCPTQGCEV